MSDFKLYCINGIWCGSCAKSVEAKLQSHFNIKSSVDLATQTLKLLGSENFSIEELNKVLKTSGYSLTDFHDADAKNKEIKTFEKKLLKRLATVVFSSMWIMSLSISRYLEIMGPLSSETIWQLNLIMALLSIPGLTYGGSFIYLMAWQNLRIKKLTIDSLVTLSVFTCISLTVLAFINKNDDLYLDSALMILLIFSSIKFLEHKIFQLQATSIYVLDEERLKYSNVFKDGRKVRKKNAQIKAGQIIQLEPGDFLFFDGEVKSGEAVVNVTSSDGEEDPRLVVPGDRLSYGAIVIEGQLLVFIHETFGDRQVDHSFRDSVAKFHENKHGYNHRFIETAIEYAAPTLLIISFCYFVINYYLLDQQLTSSLLTSLSLILVFCPCVLYLSRPLVLLAIVKNLTGLDILIRNPAALSNLKNIKSIVFDKTGTLTGDNHEIKLMNNYSNFPTEKIWKIIGGMEVKYTHPIASAVARALWKFKLEPFRLDAELLPSQGIKAHFEGHEFFFGKPCENNRINTLELCIDGKGIALFQFQALQDINKKELLEYLGKKDIKKFLLTGDSLKNADNFVRFQDLKFDKVYAEKKVREKGKVLEEIQENFGNAAYVGDGENDIGAFAKSSVSISLSNASQSIKSASDIILPSVNLKNVKTLFNASDLYQRRIKQNFALAGVYNLIAIYFSFGGYLKPSYAILAMSISTSLLLFNSTRAPINFFRF